MSDEISVESIRRIAEADDWKNFPGWKGTRALARLALRLRAEVERLKKALADSRGHCRQFDADDYDLAKKEDTIARLTAERDSWRRVAERLEGEKQAAEARAAELERALRETPTACNCTPVGEYGNCNECVEAWASYGQRVHLAALAAPEPEEPRCPTCGDKRHIPCHYAYQGCLSPGEYQTEGGQRVCARHAQIANDISGLDSWLCLENACPDCQPEGEGSET